MPTWVRHWWSLVVRGFAAVMFGILLVALPQVGLVTLVALFGAYALVDGIFALVAAVRAARGEEAWGELAFEAIASLAAAAVTLLWPGITAVALLFVIAFWALFTGILEVGAAIRLRRVIKGEGWLALAGVLSVVLGILLLAQPAAGLLALVWMIGIYAIVFGALLIGLGFTLRTRGGVGVGPGTVPG